jgi:zinc transporter ZupT
MTNPCLPHFWNKGYPAMPGLIAMIAVFMVVIVEQYFALKGAGHSHASEWDGIPDEEPNMTTLRGGEIRRSLSNQIHGNGYIALNTMEHVDGENAKASKVRNDLDGNEADDLDDLNDFDPIAGESAYLSDPSSRRRQEIHDSDEDDRASHSEQNPQKLFLQCLLLEAGILFHSIFIGMAVSVATGTQFIVLLIAICFHQTFEGFALGSRIASLIPGLFEASSPKPWLMALAYGATTPIGQAIGLGMHELYDPASEMGLLMVGITNAISSGLLLFAGLVQLIAEDFLSDRSYDVLKGRRRIEACLAVACGGLLMAIVGAFA